MNYFYLMYDYEHEPKNVLIADDYNFISIDDYDFEKGKKIKWDTRNIMYYSEGTEAEDYLAQVHPSARVVSQKIINILKKEIPSKDLQIFPVKIQNKKTGEELKNYFIINVLRIIPDALDRKKSIIDVNEIKEENLRVETIRKYSLKENKIKKYHIFRIGEGSIFISEKIKKAFEKADVTGADYGVAKLS